MAERNILLVDVPVGDTAVANINVFEQGAAEDVDSLTVEWIDHDDTTISNETYTGQDINTTGIHGETVTITNPQGDGNYKATLEIDTTTYETGAFPKTFKVKISGEDEGGSFGPRTFNFDVVESSFEVALEDLTITEAVKRESQLYEEFGQVSSGTQDRISFNSNIVYEIDAAFKNGSGFDRGSAGDTYEWKKYRPYVKLNTSPTEGDHFYFRIQTRMRSAAVEAIITDAREWVVGELQPYFQSTTSVLQSPTVLNIIKDLAVGEIRQLHSAGVALESSQFRTGIDRKEKAEKTVMHMQQGRANPLDGDNKAISRESGALVGGPMNADLDAGDVGDLLDRIVDWNKWTGFNFYDLTSEV